MASERFFQNIKRGLRNKLSLAGYIDAPGAVENIRSNIPFRGPNIYILFVAIIIASVGLNVNSIPVIIGAMLISPLMSPIIGFGLGLGTNDNKLMLYALKNLAIMFVISVIASTLYFLVTPLETDSPTELLARTNPSVYDVMIAFFGGIAGILELSRKEKGTVLSGVAIATALMPPLCTVGYGISKMNMHYAGGALYLFFINCIFIALATFIAVKFLRFPKQERQGARSWSQLILYNALLLAVLIPSFFSAINIVHENRFIRDARLFVEEHRTIGGTYIYDYSTDLTTRPYTLTLRLAGETLSDESRRQLYYEADEHGISPDQILIQEDATFEIRRLNEVEIMKDWLAQSEEQLRQRDDTIRSLQAQIAAYKALELPSQQITAELRSQWPEIDRITLARSDSSVILLLSTPAEGGTSMLQSDDVKRIKNWLSVRLHEPNVELIIKHPKQSHVFNFMNALFPQSY